RIPSTQEYLQVVGDTISKHHAQIYQYLNFNLMAEYDTSNKHNQAAQGKKIIAISASAEV
ncbi:MAG: hypothetical protein RLZZ351_823, partial [Pseudomonadota bacterium]